MSTPLEKKTRKGILRQVRSELSTIIRADNGPVSLFKKTSNFFLLFKTVKLTEDCSGFLRFLKDFFRSTIHDSFSESDSLVR